ncbi:hypothetical protein N656DRAFT_767155 [Canariomyces notabilis]|uniref:Uncharacterized protein n=1 Tax=Canariomyces notabilis TaxID=2074819 RepID=A0AAN6TGQ7_9PEZI|nr:hypothetical protein N656DRAFT_767155 [Canariomyces arenarius]
MSSDVFRKVGRGGAGNFYSKKDIEEAEKATSAAAPPLNGPGAGAEAGASGSGSTVPSYARGGRGGAGNFVFRGGPSTASAAPSAPTTGGESASSPSSGPLSPDTAQQELLAAAEAERTRVAIAASIAAKTRTGGLSGRGGAGNWTGGGGAGGSSGSDNDGEQGPAAAEELELKVLREVEDGLAFPGRVYHAPGARGDTAA